MDVACFLYGRNPDGFVNDFAGSPVPSLGGATKHGLMQNICGAPPPDTPLPPPPFPELPFSGGQCDGALYHVDYSITGFTTSEPSGAQTPVGTSGTEFNMTGPIGSRRDSEGAGRMLLQLTGSSPGGGQDLRPVFAAGNPSGPLTITSFEVTPRRVDGGLDDCGDPPPQYPGGGYVAPPPELRVPGLPGGSNVVIAPTFNFNVGVNGPVLRVEVENNTYDFDAGGVTINFPGGGGGDSPGGGGGAPPGPGNSEPDPDTPVDPPPDEDPDPPPETELVRTLRGAYVTLTGESKSETKLFPSGNGSSLYFPDLGLIYFRVRSPDGQVGFTPPVRMQLRQCYYECPSFFGAIDVIVHPRPSVSASIRPVYYVEEVPSTE